MKFLLFSITCLTLYGCASPRIYTQEGLSLERDNPAKIACDSERNHKVLLGLNRKLYITAIDGESTLTWSSTFSDVRPYAEAAYLKPGRHYLDLVFTFLNSDAHGTVWFDAEAGGSYLVRWKMSGYGVSTWVEDLNTHKVIGGVPGTEPSEGNPD